MKVKIDANMEVNFLFDKATVHLCSIEISRYNKMISKMESVSDNGKIDIYEQCNNRTSLTFESDSLTQNDIQDIKKYIQSVIRASATNRIMEYKAGIVAAKTRLKEII